MKKEVKKMLDISVKIIGILFILFLFYFFVFVMFRPFMGEVTQDRPIMKVLCEMQVECDAVGGPYQCTEDSESDWFHRLKRWEKFKGCNNSTDGYTENNKIMLEYCSCGGLM